MRAMRPSPAEYGFTLIAVLLALALFTSGIAAAATVWHTAVQRSKEADLVFIGGEFKRAIESYYFATRARSGSRGKRWRTFCSTRAFRHRAPPAQDLHRPPHWQGGVGTGHHANGHRRRVQPLGERTIPEPRDGERRGGDARSGATRGDGRQAFAGKEEVFRLEIRRGPEREQHRRARSNASSSARAADNYPVTSQQAESMINSTDAQSKADPVAAEPDATRSDSGRTGAAPADSQRANRGLDLPDLDDVAVLGQYDQECLLRAIEYALPVRRRSQFFVWAQGHLQSLIAHEMLLCATSDHLENTCSIVNISALPLSRSQLTEMADAGTGLAPCAIDAWHRLGEEPLMIHSEMKNAVEYERLRGCLVRYKLANLVVHGVRSIDGTKGTYFMFAEIPHAFGARQAYLLRLILPHLHMAFERVLATEHQQRSKEPSGKTPRKLLTGREINILQWVQEGKSNRDIGAILEISPLTVKNHVRSILKKLNAQNRAQAVSRALSLQILN